MKYIISRMLLLINSIIITVQLDDNDYNNTPETTDHQEYNIPLSEYQKYITTYQHYSIFTNIFMFISTLLQFIIFLYTVFVFGVIIKEATANKWWEKLGAILIQISFWTLLTLLLIIPIKYPGFWICPIVFLFFYFLFVFVGFYICKKFCLFFIPLKKPMLIVSEGRRSSLNIKVKPFEKLGEVEVETINFESIKDQLFNLVFSLVGITGLGVWVVLSIITKIVTFWSEKGSVIKDIKNWISTSNIMRYILRNINNKFNIFSLPIASTNITLSESISSLLFSLITVIVIIAEKPEED